MDAFHAGVVAGMLKEARRKRRRKSLKDFQQTAQVVARRVAKAVIDDLFGRAAEGQMARWR